MMRLLNTSKTRFVLSLAVMALATPPVLAADLGTAFTYQGQLIKNETPVDDTCTFTFRLWNDDDAGSEVGTSPIAGVPIVVDGGRFAATLDFGHAAIKGQARWLEIEVQCPGDGGPTTLVPRVELTPIPHALSLPGLYTQQNGTSANLIGGFVGNSVNASAVGATIGGGGNSFFDNRVADDYGTIGGGSGNQAGDNAGTTTDAIYATVGGGFANEAKGSVSSVGGGGGNEASGYGSTVPGGENNEAGGHYSFAAGHRAKVRNNVLSGDAGGDEGTFVWADDSTTNDFVSTGPNQFLIRSVNGVGINTNAPTATLHMGGIPGGTNGIRFPDGTLQLTASAGDGDTLASLQCADGQVAKWDATFFVWHCADDLTGIGDGDTLAELECTDGQVAKWNSTLMAWECANDTGGNTLDQAYDQGGPGAGRVITADAGAVVIDGAGGLDVAGKIECGNTIIIDGAAGNEHITSSEDLEVYLGGEPGFGHRIIRLERKQVEAGGTWLGPNILGGWDQNQITTGATGVVIHGGGGTDGANIWEHRVTDTFGTIGGGADNHVGNGNSNVTDARWATIGGGASNRARGQYSTIAGGSENQANTDVATVCGGDQNQATALGSAVCGGGHNTATGNYSVAAGGWFNNAEGNRAAVLGGESNNAFLAYSVASGGQLNIAGGSYAMVPGGRSNKAGGDYSFAGGRKARVRDAADSGDADGDEGTFMWADSTDAEFHSAGPDQFLVRAKGGATIYSNSSLTAGVSLSAGGGSWSTVSDRNMKENVADVDPSDVLNRLMSIPITTWNYKSQDPSIRHIGPMGQDFRAAFDVGEVDTRLATIDADGVALAAIQGLHGLVEQGNCKLIELEKRNAELEAELASLRTLIQCVLQKNEPALQGDIR